LNAFAKGILFAVPDKYLEQLGWNKYPRSTNSASYMYLYKNIIACAYKSYSKSIYEDAYFSSILFISASQQLVMLDLLILFGKIISFDFYTFLFPNVMFVLIATAIWIVVTFKMYSKKKVKKYVEEYESKAKKQKYFWGVISILSLVVPAILIVLLTKK
jgi:large-conductance mechanosensitive channel